MGFPLPWSPFFVDKQREEDYDKSIEILILRGGLRWRYAAQDRYEALERASQERHKESLRVSEKLGELIAATRHP